MLEINVPNVIIYFTGYFVLTVGTAKLFEKAGVPKWKGFIPVYNMYLTYRLTWNTGKFWLLMAITILTGIFTIVQNILEGTMIQIEKFTEKKKRGGLRC